MNKLYAGFSRVNVTPMMGIRLSGYFIERHADGVLDDLEINALALACGDEKVLILSVDQEGIHRQEAAYFRKLISEKTGVSETSIYIHATHTHTSPYLEMASGIDIELEYFKFVSYRMVDVAKNALEDLKPARMGYGIGQAPGIAFVRRFRMKDGTIQTNPGINNPNISEPIGEIDERVSVLRFDREDGDTLVLVNYGNHPDVIGGCKISTDWPGFVRQTVEKVLDNTKCIFMNGAQGEINHINVQPTDGYSKNLFLDYFNYNLEKRYRHAKLMSHVITGGVLHVFDRVEYIDVHSIKALQRTITVPAQVPKPEDMPEAHRINDLHQAGRDEELPYKRMMLTTVVAEAERMVRLEHGPESFDMELSGVAIGNVALIGIPGEPFVGIGKALKETDGWDLVIPTCMTNGNEGYFPMLDAYEQGGYEARSSYFKAGVSEYMIEEGKKLLADLK